MLRYYTSWRVVLGFATWKINTLVRIVTNRHNNVLLLLASAVRNHLKAINKKGKKSRALIHFVKAGQRAAVQSDQKLYGLLSAANDWVCDFDLPEFHPRGSQYVFPHDVCITPTRIDGFIISRSAKICVGLELTCPMEENVTKHHWTKLEKYEGEITTKQRRMDSSSTLS